MHLLNHDTLIKAVCKHLVVQTCVYELKSAIWSNLFRIFRSFDDLMFESMQLLSSKCRLSTTKNNVTLQFQTENSAPFILHTCFFFVVILQNEICNIDSKYKKEKKNVIILMANIKASSENSSSDAKYIYGRFLPHPQILHHQMFFLSDMHRSLDFLYILLCSSDLPHLLCIA